MNDLYQSDEWKRLAGTERAQLLLVVEGLKKGAVVEGNWTFFIDIIKKNGLDYQLYTDKYGLNPVFVVARTNDIHEESRKYITLPKNANRHDYHKIIGWLLGYPECCTAEYIRERTPEQRMAEQKKQHHLSYKFGQELTDMITNKGNYPEIFDYRPPSFTPCGIDCPEAIRLLASYKDAIDTLDPEAGRELVYFNRKSFPEELVHKDYLLQERIRRIMDNRLEFLRKSVNNICVTR